jgi:hypothetical protein
MIVMIVLLSSSLQNNSKAQVSVNVSFQTFYDELSPYGDWINYPEYGYVWSPGDRYRNFHPYRSEGHWVWTDDYGWLWASDYDWGWAPFHYGRWLYDSYYGWIWVPDYEWSPAWVTWRSGGGYYGWAPMSPGININLYFGRYTPSYDYWCFAPTRYITSSRISNYYVDASQNTTIINNTTVINNYSTRNNSYTSGPTRTEAERYTGTQIRSSSISESRSPGRTRVRNNEVAIYKPSIDKQSSRNNAPKKFERYNKSNTTEVRNNDRVERNNNNTDTRRERNTFPNRDVINQPERREQEVNREQPRSDVRPDEDRQPRQERRQIERPVQQERRMPDRQIERQPQQERRQIERPVQQERRMPDRQIERQPQQERRIFENRQPQTQSQPQYQNRGNQQSVPQQSPGNNGNNGRGRGRGNG